MTTHPSRYVRQDPACQRSAKCAPYPAAWVIRRVERKESIPIFAASLTRSMCRRSGNRCKEVGPAAIQCSCAPSRLGTEEMLAKSFDRFPEVAIGQLSYAWHRPARSATALKDTAGR